MITLRTACARASAAGVLALALSTPKVAVGDSFGLLYGGSGNIDFTGQHTESDSGGYVTASSLTMAPLELAGGISGAGYNLEGATDASGYVTYGSISGITVANVYNPLGNVAGTASASFQGGFIDTLTPNYTGSATFTLDLESFLATTENGILTCLQLAQIDAGFNAGTGTSGGEASIQRLPCDGTQNSITQQFTISVTAGHPIDISGELLLSARAYGDSSVGPGYTFADPPTGGFFVQDTDGNGSFTSASGHDYSPTVPSPVPEPTTLTMCAESILVCLGIVKIRTQRKGRSD